MHRTYESQHRVAHVAMSAALFLGAAGCTAQSTGDGGGNAARAPDASFSFGADASTARDGSSAQDARSTADLHGLEPAVALDVPTFVATNYDGGSRNQDALLGHPTVLWFFPFAGTPG